MSKDKAIPISIMSEMCLHKHCVYLLTSATITLKCIGSFDDANRPNHMHVQLMVAFRLQ